LNFILTDTKAISDMACSTPEVHRQCIQLWGQTAPNPEEHEWVY